MAGVGAGTGHGGAVAAIRKYRNFHKLYQRLQVCYILYSFGIVKINFVSYSSHLSFSDSNSDDSEFNF